MATLPEVEQQKSFKYLEEVETVGQDILTLKEEKLELANAQNKFREGLRALEQVYERNTWMQLGSVYVERPTEECKGILRKEISKAEDDLKSLHEEVKTKVHKLRDLEHEPRLEGFTLKPISLAEAKALHKGFGNDNMGPKVAAGFVIFRRISGNIEYLLLQTSYGIHHWTPPKGHVDPGETELVTAYRETQEESGLSKSDIKVYEDTKKTLNYEVNGKPKTVYYWLAELINPSATVRLSHEHQDYKWLPLKEACDIAGYKDMQDVLVDFDNFLKNKSSL